jgi:hypothetical protein
MAHAQLARRGLIALALGAHLAACGEPPPQVPAAPDAGGTDTSDEGTANPTYEQSFVFASVRQDSVFLVPWLIRTIVSPDTVFREVHGWLARSGAWDAFLSESWTTPPSRTPSRILPYGNLRLLVQEGDVVDGIIFERGTRRLELALGAARASWGGPRGEAIEVLEGGAYLSDDRVEGLVLHLARASSGATPPGGDWAFLISGDSLVLVLAADDEHREGADPLYRGWARLGEEDRLWTNVRVAWESTQAFPPARRDVPVSWRIASGDRLLMGALEVVSADIQSGDGPGPLLPVRAMYEVVGEVAMPEGAYPVRGLLVHERR